jgi:hypothetical protein
METKTTTHGHMLADYKHEQRGVRKAAIEETYQYQPKSNNQNRFKMTSMHSFLQLSSTIILKVEKDERREKVKTRKGAEKTGQT